jgi:hypothetical protein
VRFMSLNERLTLKRVSAEFADAFVVMRDNEKLS